MMFASQSQDGAWWLPLLEKAFAKVNINYERLGLGWMSESMRILTGAPSQKFTSSQLSVDQLWRYVEDADNSDFLLTAATQ